MGRPLSIASALTRYCQQWLESSIIPARMSNELLDYTEDLAQKLQLILSSFAQQQRPELAGLLQRWQEQLQQMRAYAEGHTHVSLALVGGTGSGKSTLLNALLEADLLPTHSFRTCTSAAIEVAYAARKSWRATIQFLPLSAWQEEKEHFLAEARESQASGHSSFGHQDFLYKAWSLYRPRAGQPPMPFPLAKLIDLLQEPLPESLLKQIAQGTLILKSKTASELKQQLTRYLTAESPVWPFIQQVLLEGPLPLLKDGLRLIDLPGLNDPNPVREAITRSFLQQAEFIGMVFGTGRGLTRDVIELLKDQHFITQMVLDGKVSALSFIGTRADDFVSELEWANLAVSPDADRETIRQAREIQIRQLIQQQLSELTLWFGNRYKVSEQSQHIISLISNTLQQSPIFVASALSYQAQLGWLPQQPQYFAQAIQTGLPDLQAFARQIVAEHGIKARKKLIRSQFQQLNHEIRRLVESLRQKQSVAHLASDQASRLQIALTQVYQAHLRSFQTVQHDLIQALHLKQVQFEKQLLYAFSDLQRRLEQVLEQWQDLNWQYLQRAVANDGRYTSPTTGVQVNLNRDILRFIENEVALDWYEFFQHRLLKEVDQARSLLNALLEQVAQAVRACLQKDAPQLLSQSESLLQAGQQVIEQLSWRARKDLEQKIRATQMRMELVLAEGVQAAMQPVYAEAAQLSGTGVKKQILDKLTQELNQHLSALTQEIKQPVSEALLDLVQAIEQHHKALTQEFLTSLETLCQIA